MSIILIIDDSETLRIQLREVLQSEKHTTLEAGNGIEALDLLTEKSKEIDLIFVDQNMPRMDGITFCQNFKDNFGHLNIPVVMLTTETNADLKKRSKELGVKGWIMKPFVKDSLILGVEYLLKKKKEAA